MSAEEISKSGIAKENDAQLSDEELDQVAGGMTIDAPFSPRKVPLPPTRPPTGPEQPSGPTTGPLPPPKDPFPTDPFPFRPL
jgi:hypothetical protein